MSIAEIGSETAQTSQVDQTTYIPIARPAGVPRPVRMPSDEERLIQQLADPNVRLAELRTSLPGSSEDEGAKVIAHHVAGVMLERGVGPASPYVTHHDAVAVAMQALSELVEVTGVPTGEV